MACIDEQLQPNFKHYCRVCKKGFMCGRALGGHMRAHGIGCENGNIDNDGDLISDWEEKLGGGGGEGGADRTSIKRMYQLRTNPNRLKSCKNCEHCGKEFLSWKSFLEHGKCSLDDASASVVSSPESGDEYDGETHGTTWSKRKRSARAKVGNIGSSTYVEDEDEDLVLARCLIQLANSIVEPPRDEPEESSASRDEEERRNSTTFFGSITSRGNFDKAKGISFSTPKGSFECKACKKVFTSHQALGGHRASHKKVKGCYAARQDLDEQVTAQDQATFSRPKPTSSFQLEQGQSTILGASGKKPKGHECSICHRVFTSGQALGGHKRCHWITSYSPDTSSLAKFPHENNIEQAQHNFQSQIEKPDKLDLNFPAWVNNMLGIRRDPHNPLSFDVSTDVQCTDSDSRINSPYWDSQHCQPKNEDDTDKNVNNNVCHETKNNVYCITDNNDDEVDSKLKLAKLSETKDLKDMDKTESSSQWLQVGISSVTKDTST